jgi:hypothetical protein
MKKLIVYLLPLVFLFSSCTGDSGPPGPPGQPGGQVLGQTFEIQNINFQYDTGRNLFSTLIEVPSDIEVFESDAILVYRLEINQGVETFSQIPQQFYLANDREIQYVFNHTNLDIELLITGNFDLGTLSFDFTDNQIFRFVVVPSDFAKDPNNDLSTFQSLTQAVSKNKKQLETIDY